MSDNCFYYTMAGLIARGEIVPLPDDLFWISDREYMALEINMKQEEKPKRPKWVPPNWVRCEKHNIWHEPYFDCYECNNEKPKRQPSHIKP